MSNRCSGRVGCARCTVTRMSTLTARRSLRASRPHTSQRSAARRPDTEPTTTSVALITGGGRGLGRRLAGALATNGVTVGLVARSGAELDHTVGVIEAAGGAVAARTADVTDAAALGVAVDELTQELGPV